MQIQQFLTDVAATGEAGGFDEARKALDSARADLDKVATLEPQLLVQVGEVKAGLEKYQALGVDMAKAYVVHMLAESADKLERLAQSMGESVHKFSV